MYVYVFVVALKFGVRKSFFPKKLSFIQQGCIKLIKRFLFQIYAVLLNFLFIKEKQRTGKNISKNIKQLKCFEPLKCKKKH